MAHGVESLFAAQKKKKRRRKQFKGGSLQREQTRETERTDFYTAIVLRPTSVSALRFHETLKIALMGVI
jgi:hypothetical protein